MGMCAVCKGSPIGLAKNIYDSIKMGQWRNGDIKQHQVNVGEVLATTQMSDEGKHAVADLMRRGGSGGATMNLSANDMMEFKQLETGLHIAAGNCINF